MVFADEKLVCQDCGKEFIFTASEQEFFQKKGFESKPKRCPDCRRKRKEQRRAQKVMYDIVCSKCGKPGQVPFEPKDPKAELLCEKCFREKISQK